MIRAWDGESFDLLGNKQDFVFDCVGKDGEIVANVACRVEDGVLCVHMAPINPSPARIREMQQDFIALVRTFKEEAGIKTVMISRPDDGGEIYDRFIAHFGFRHMVQMFFSIAPVADLIGPKADGSEV